jgi:hypothetical protein
MMEGLTEVVQFLLPELAMAGEQGKLRIPHISIMSVTNKSGLAVDEFLELAKLFLNGGKKAVQAYQRVSADRDGNPSSSATPLSFSNAELSFARGAWTWLVARPNVLVGNNRRWNKLSLDDVLALPDPSRPGQPVIKKGQDETGVAEASSSSQSNVQGLKPQGPKPKGPSARPRLFVTEETIWRAIAGHGIDYKRIPKLEWQLLQGIAQAKHAGILQGELRQLSGQDKRSVPKRTDFLAAKGYIAKRSIMVRASKTSKLWLVNFAPSATTEGTEQSVAKQYDMSKGALTRDLSPVPWHSKWSGADIDVETFAESIIVIVKAWGVIRYADLRLKMGVEELRWQMRVMARLSRNLVDMGILKYTAATFSNQKKVWKDCIKFLRDPTESEWAQILATGKKTSKYSDLSKDRQPKPLALAMTKPETQPSEGGSKDSEEALGAPPAQLVSRGAVGWIPEKPLAQTLFDTVEAAGPGGASNPQISAATVGYNFRRYIGTMLTNIALCKQPLHLQKFQINRELVRKEKTTTFIYTTSSNTGHTLQDTEAAAGLSGKGGQTSTVVSTAPAPTGSPYGFGPIQKEKLAAPAMSLAEISQKLKGRKQRSINKTRFRRAGGVLIPVELPDDRSPKRQCIAGPDDATPASEEEAQPPQRNGVFIPGVPEEFLPGQPDGVYRGEPNSLQPKSQRRGRAKKSAVVIFRHEKLKNPGFWALQMPPGPGEISLHVKYDSFIGEIRLQKANKMVVFFSRPALSDGISPAISVDELLEDPNIRSLPTGEHMRLFFVTKEVGETPSRTYSFLFRQDEASQREAREFLEQVTAILHPPPAPEKPPVSDDKHNDSTVAEADMSGMTEAADTQEPEPAQSTGKGNGKKRGIRKRDIRCWKCEKCGGTWKNDIGLKYHLEKSQNPCNPNFVAAAPMPKMKRRRSLTPPPSIVRNSSGLEQPLESTPSGRPVRQAAAAAASQIQEQDSEEPRPQVITARRPGPRPRYVPKLYDTGPAVFRGLSVDDSLIKRADLVATPVRQRDTRPSEYTYVPKLILSPNRPKGSTPQAGRKSHLEGEQPGPKAKELVQPAETIGLKPRVFRNASHPHRNVSNDGKGAAENGQDSMREEDGVLPQLRPSEPETPRRYPAFKPADYTHHTTESKMRTAQAMDIIEYLLDCNEGVFPGDKALFYAMLKIFLRTFPTLTPPSLRSTSAAVRKLNSRNKAREIVHALRSNGKFVTCHMLVAADIDVKDEAPTQLKKKMQEAYPKIYIPASFSPSQEEMKVLEQMDPRDITETPEPNANTDKFRKRREGIEVEILTAPFYQENPGHIPGQFNGPDSPTQRRKRRTKAEIVADEAEASRKRRKTIGNRLLKNAPADGQGTGEGSQDAEAMSWEASNDAESADIANAIKQFGLLPPQRGGKKKALPNVAPMKKLDPLVGRKQNPGLDSLPALFFSNKIDPRLLVDDLELQFLQPNTRLEDSCDWTEDSLASEVSRASGSSIQPTYEVSMPPKGEMEPVGRFMFQPTRLTLKHTCPGVWPAVDFHFSNSSVEERGDSYTMQGWFPDRRWFFLQSLPRDVNNMSSMVKGRTIDPKKYADPVYGAFTDTVDRCARWEQSETGTFVMTSDTVAPDYVYINFGTPFGKIKKGPLFRLEWPEENQFTIDTIPWEDLESMSDIDGGGDEEEPPKKLAATLLKRPRGRPPKSPETRKKDRAKGGVDTENGEKAKMGRRPKKNRLPAIATSRIHTPYPRDENEYMEVHRGKELTKEWNSEHTQLAAFVCVSTLVGGVGKAVDWGLMMRLFPHVSLSHLRKFWGDLNKDRKSTIVDLTDKFQKAFLEAYEKGELPPLNYEDYVNYDWRYLINWTKGLAGAISDLPASYKDLEDSSLIVSDQQYQPRDWRETFWVPNRSLYNRHQDASSQAFAMSIDAPEKKDEDLLNVAMSWVRALCVTDRTQSENVISRRWASFKGLPRDQISEIINEAVQRLQDTYVITKDKGPSTIRLNDRVVKLLEKQSQELKFAEAAAFKRRLDKTFRKGKKHRVRYQADRDGHTLALLNLQAHGRINIETENKYVPLGYMPGNYETRKYNKKNHHFRLYAVPTDRYVYSSENEFQRMPDDQYELIDLLNRISSTPAPDQGPQGELPIWCDFLGVVDERRWRKCLGAVIFLLSVRGPMRADQAAEQLKFLMPFEVQLVFDWADALGLMEQMTPGAPKSLTEWWWVAVDAQRVRVEGLVRKDKGKGVDLRGGQGDVVLGEAAVEGGCVGEVDVS